MRLAARIALGVLLLSSSGLAQHPSTAAAGSLGKPSTSSAVPNGVRQGGAPKDTHSAAVPSHLTFNYIFTTIDYPGAQYTQANGISSSGQIVGSFVDANGNHGFLDNAGNFSSIDYPGHTGTFVTGVNGSGQIVGYYGDTGTDLGFLDNGGVFTPVEFPGGQSTAPFGLNNPSAIVGSYADANGVHGFLDIAGNFSTIDVPGAHATDDAAGINGTGQIVGSYSDTGGEHGFLDTAGTFSTIDCPGSTFTTAGGINGAAQIVGHYVDASGFGHGYLYTAGNCINIDFPLATTTYAYGVDDAGRIVGVYFKDGVGHAFLATPGGGGSCYAPPNNTMVAWYPFDETSGVTSENLATGNVGKWFPQDDLPVPVPGMVGGALSFNGTDQYVESPSTIVTEFGPGVVPSVCKGVGQGGYSSCSGDFSIDTWIRVPPQASRDVMTILDKRSEDLAGNIRGYHFFLYNGLMGVQLADSDYSNYGSPALPSIYDSRWHHIAVTIRRSSAQGINWYYDGHCVDSNCTTSNPTDRFGSLVSKSPLRIGTRTAFEPLTGWFEGSLDELEIYNRVLTPAEILGIYSAQSLGKCKP